MFGVVFEGHPDLRRIHMPEDYEGFPQRRDFPVGSGPAVLFTYNEEQERTAEYECATGEDRATMSPDDYRSARSRLRQPSRPARRARPRAADAEHRAPPTTTHGVLRLIATLEGEVVRDPQADHRLRAHGDREDRRGQGVLEGDPGHRADGLPVLLLQCDGVLRRGRDVARRRGAAARSISAGNSPRAQSDRLPPILARGTGALDLGAISIFWCCLREPRDASSTCSRCPRASGCTPATSRSAA